VKDKGVFLGRSLLFDFRRETSKGQERKNERLNRIGDERADSNGVKVEFYPAKKSPQAIPLRGRSVGSRLRSLIQGSRWWEETNGGGNRHKGRGGGPPSTKKWKKGGRRVATSQMKEVVYYVRGLNSRRRGAP